MADPRETFTPPPIRRHDVFYRSVRIVGRDQGLELFGAVIRRSDVSGADAEYPIPDRRWGPSGSVITVKRLAIAHGVIPCPITAASGTLRSLSAGAVPLQRE